MLATILPSRGAIADIFSTSSLAYDPVQLLLAVGTKETTFGSGQIYVFGQSRVQLTFTLPRRAS